MIEPVTFANPDVLQFYKELPFNYHQSDRDQAELIRRRDAVRGYPALLALLAPGMKVLEVGCGVGWLALSLSLHHACTVTAIDFNPIVIDRARRMAGQLGQNVRFEIADLFLYEPIESANLVVSLGVLHHTNNCLHAVRRLCNRFLRVGGYLFVGLYHRFGRRPFLGHFQEMRESGCSEDALYTEYRRLHASLKDDTFARSWFRDQVLHPHETQHTLAELLSVFDRCGISLLSTSINHFAPFRAVDDLLALEPGLEENGRAALARGEYYPGFFLALARKTGDTPGA